jgi:hypothetical protein
MAESISPLAVGQELVQLGLAVLSPLQVSQHQVLL